MDSKVIVDSIKPVYKLPSAKTPSKLNLLKRKDSGYNSSSPGPTPTPATSSTEGTVIRRSLSGACVQNKSSSGETSPETDLDSPELLPSEQPLTLVTNSALENTMQRTLNASPQRAYEEDLPAEDIHHFAHLQQHTSTTHTSSVPHTSTPSTNLNTDDRLLLAFKCRGSHTDWNRCTHPYCYQVRKQWDSFKKCCADILHCCSECSKFKHMILIHSKSCTIRACPVAMCSETKNFLQAQKEQIRQGTLVRSQSFHERTPVSENAGLPFYISNFHPTQYNSNGLGVYGYSSLGENPGSVSMEIIQAKAQEIVDRLDKEEPLLSNNPAPVSGRPQSLTQEDLHGNQGAGGSALSPIVEMQEDLSQMSPMSPSNDYSFDNPPVSLILRSHQFESFGAYSSLGDGPGDGKPSTVSQHSSLSGDTSQLVSMVVEQGQEEVQVEKVYPRQNVVHKLDNEFLRLGSDGYYFQHRNYYLNDIDFLGSGGFGTCMFGKDNITEQPFAMKRNKESGESIIDTMKAECFVLSRLRPHNHVVRFLGAVVDEEDSDVLLPRVYKMFMELADCGTLAEMLTLEDGTKEALPVDQSLYYIEQILQGVHFLHQNSVLHLDIKALNVLVFDGGRTVKLADFGTAIQLSEIAAVGGRITGCTPYFAAPEVVREEQPGFSSDIWGVMCVLVEILTTNWPGCHSVTKSQQQMIFLVGQYQDSDIEQLIPFSKYSEIDSEIVDLFRWVFVADQTQRPSALTLLNHPRIKEAPEYITVFDGYGMDEEMSMEASDMAQQAPPSIGQAVPIHGLPSSQVPLASHYQSGVSYTPSLPSQYPAVGQGVAYPPTQAPYINGQAHISFDQVHNSIIARNCSQTSHPSLQPHPFSSLDLERDHPSSYQHDSYETEEGFVSYTSRGQPLGSATSCGNGGTGYKTLDSGLDTAVDSSIRSKYSSWSAEPFLTQSLENYEDYHSFPFADSASSRSNFKRSASMTGSTYKTNKSDSHAPISVSQPRKLVPSNHRLYHSYSAPIVGDQYSHRKPSLQMTRDNCESGEGRLRLRRTSSMVYVDKGPEIDSPDKEKRASIEELISDVSGLNLDACSPSHFKPYAKGVASTDSGPHTTATVVKLQCGRGLHSQGATHTNQKSATVYETIC